MTVQDEGAVQLMHEVLNQIKSQGGYGINIDIFGKGMAVIFDFYGVLKVRFDYRDFKHIPLKFRV